MHVGKQHCPVQPRHGGAAARRTRLVTAVDKDPPTFSGEELSHLILDVATKQDRQAFALLFKHFAPRLKTYLLRAGASEAMADEVIQETMLSVWRKASYYDPARAGAATWIFTIARNLRVDQQRRNRAAAPSDLDLAGELDPAPVGESVLIAGEREQQVRAALAALSAEQATIVRLSFFNDKPHAEIARELSIPLGTVKSRIRLAMTRLRALLGEQQE